MAFILSPWGRDTTLRGALATALVALVVCSLGAATDEGGVGWALRVSRTLPLLPMCSGAGAWLALGAARSKGELVALEALGVSPARAVLGAALGSASVSVLAALAISLFARIDVSPFFPAAHATGSWVFDGAAFVDEAQAIRVSPAGEIARIADAAERAPAELRGGRFAAAAVTATSGVAMALCLARMRRGNVARTLSMLAAFSFAVVILLQAAGARVVTPHLAPLASAALLLASLAVYREKSA